MLRWIWYSLPLMEIWVSFLDPVLAIGLGVIAKIISELFGPGLDELEEAVSLLDVVSGPSLELIQLHELSAMEHPNLLEPLPDVIDGNSSDFPIDHLFGVDEPPFGTIFVAGPSERCLLIEVGL